jgi:predicted amidohydrolase YtcJ
MRALLIASALLLSAPAQAAEPPADTVLWGGPVYTAVDARPTAQAVAVRAGRIAYVGDRRGAQAMVGPKTQVIDLRGGALFPGFVDAHAHLRGIGERELTLNLEGTASIAALVERVRSEAAKAKPGAVITGRGWIETGWPEGRFPSRDDLDRVSPNHPVILERADGHAVIANSAALTRAGVTPATVAPSGGEILKDAGGRPTGMLIDAAQSLVERLAAKPSPEQIANAYRTGGQLYARYGWTGLHNMSVPWDDVAVMERLSAQGALPLRVYNNVDGSALDQLIASGPRRSPNGRIETRSIKLYIDGALGSRGAALLAPYSDANTSGLVLMQPAAFAGALKRALAANIQVATHAIGDRGNRLVLDGYEAALRGAPRADRRWRVEHAQVIAPADIPRFAKLDVIASMQPSHAIGDLHFAPARLGQERLAGAYAWRTLLEDGARVVGGSDAPVERGDPLIEFYAAVARRDLTGFTGPGWHPEQALDRASALKLFTAWPAYAAFREADLGTIEVGKRADLTAFSVDLMTAPVEAIPRGRALLTMVDGEMMHDAGTR